MTKPTIYFAGKIEHDDWRFAITRTWNSSDDCNPDAKWDCGAFYYGGPFFISKNHGMDEHASQSRRREIWGTNLTLIRRADLVFAYIDCTSCYGTLIELGAASENHKIIGVAFGPDLSKSDRQNLWMAGECASRRYDMSLEPGLAPLRN